MNWKEKGEYQQAFEIFKTLADEHNVPKAHYQLGLMYFNGCGIDPNYLAALSQFNAAATQGYAKANAALGYMHANGCGAEKDTEKALTYYAQASQYNGLNVEQNQVQTTKQKSAHYKSTHYYSEKAQQCYLQRDYKNALEYGQIAIELGDTRAHITMGKMYRDGNGVEIDPLKALSHFEEANNAGYPDALALIAEAIFRFSPHTDSLLTQAAHQGSGLAQVYRGESCEWIIREEAIEYFEKGAALGIVEAYNLAGLYQEYYCSDLKKAMEYYQQGMIKLSSRSCMMIGKLYERGKGIERDYALATHFYNKAKEIGRWDPEKFHIKKGFLDSWNFSEQTASQYIEDLQQRQPSLKNTEQAAIFNHNWPLAEQGDASALSCVGVMYLNGTYVEKNDSKAEQYLIAAYENGDRDTKANSAYMLATGYREKFSFFKRDIKSTLEWNKKASDAGHKDASYEIAVMLMNEWFIGNETKNKIPAYLELADKQGHSEAAFKLYCWHKEEGNIPNADKWLNIAVLRGHQQATEIQQNLELIQTSDSNQLAENTLATGMQIIDLNKDDRANDVELAPTHGLNEEIEHILSRY